MFQKGRDNVIQLQDGRDFGYSQIGSSKGKPILFFHGWPGTRLDISCFHEEALKLGVKIISIDRPGCGLSSYQKKRKMSDLIQDVIELLDHLKITKISLLGFSTGGFYALDLAKAYPEIIETIGIVSGVPYYQLEYENKDLPILLRFVKFISKFPFLIRFVSRIMTDVGLNSYKRNPEKEYRRSLKELTQIDRETWEKAKIKFWLIEQYLPDLQQSPRKGITHDLVLLLKSFSSQEKRPTELIGKYPVYFWHGEDDTIVLPIFSIQQEKLFEKSEMVIYPREGHKVIYTHFEEIIQKIISK